MEAVTDTNTNITPVPATATAVRITQRNYSFEHNSTVLAELMLSTFCTLLI